MGMSYFDVKSALGGSGIGTSAVPVLSASEIDRIATIFDKLNRGQQVSQAEIDTTTEQLAQGLEDPGYAPILEQLINELYYNGCGSHQAQARMIGLLLSPEGQPILQQWLKAPDPENLVAQILSPEECQRLLEITSEPNSTLRVESLFELVCSKLPPPQALQMPRGSGYKAAAEEHASLEESLRRTRREGDDPPEAAVNSHPTSSFSGRSTGDTLPPLQDAIRDANTAQIKALIDQSSQPVEVANRLALFGSEAMPVIAELMQDSQYRDIAHSAMIQLGSISNQPAVQTEQDVFSPPAPHTQVSSILDLSQLEQLLLSPETLPSTLGKLISLGSHGQASLCELLVSL